MPTMLILRGKAGKYPDEQGNIYNYTDGALHEGAALKYAERRKYTGQVLPVAGLAKENSEQTNKALEKFRETGSDITAFYGFSAGGLNLKHILDEMTPDELVLIKLLVVVGAPENPPTKYQPSNYGDKDHVPKWELVYKTNPSPTAPFVPKGAGPHMFGPEWLLWELDNPKKK